MSTEAAARLNYDHVSYRPLSIAIELVMEKAH